MQTTEAVEERGIVTYQPSESRALSLQLTRMGQGFHAAAQESILGVIGPDDGYTQTEIDAMVALEELRLVNGMDLYAILYRGKLMREIEDQGLWSCHPNSFQSMEEAARAQGISSSEYSNIRDLTQVIFPYIEENLGVQIAVVWDSVKKSNFRELVPVMKMIITGEDAQSPQTRAAAANLLAGTAEAMRVTAEQRGEDEPEEDVIRRQVVSDLLAAGEQMTNRELRNHIRSGNHASPISPSVIQDGESRIFIVSMDADQYTALQRKLGAFMEEPLFANLPADPRQRRAQAARIRVLRDVMNLIEGE